MKKILGGKIQLNLNSAAMTALYYDAIDSDVPEATILARIIYSHYNIDPVASDGRRKENKKPPK